MAYARAFLDDSKSNQSGNKKVKDLKDIFRCFLTFVFVCIVLLILFHPPNTLVTQGTFPNVSFPFQQMQALCPGLQYGSGHKRAIDQRGPV